MWIDLLILLLVAVATVLVLAALRPNQFRVERGITIDAPAERVFPLIDDFHRWADWSPWEHLDPAMQRTWGDIPHGPGASYAWEGNKKVGAGRMEILRSEAAKRIQIKLDFLRPFEAHNITDFTLAPEGSGTRVIWAMHGPSPFISKLMGLFFNLDRLIGKDFEAGLAKLKAVAEG